MKAYTRIKFDNGTEYQANLKGAGIDHIDRKVLAIVRRLEGSTINAIHWDTYYRQAVPGREFTRVNKNWHVTGKVYRVDLGASITKEFR